ncbi:MAG: hypothetical protein RW306_00430 [Geobacteraceae bacterium]|nr:hypothetical protein [Geobacteraceae bacterium]
MRLLGRIAMLGGVTLAVTACGKKGALVYPDMLVPAAPPALSAMQSGAGVKIQFVLPSYDRAGNRLNNLSGLKINKRLSDASPEQKCRSCMEDYRLFRKLYLDLLPDGTERSGNRMVVLDGDVSDGKFYSYFVVPFTKDGVDGAPSPQVTVQVAQAVLPPILHAESHPTEIKLEFVSLPPLEGVAVGYNLYRTMQKNGFSHMPVNREPLTGKEYVDSGLARGTSYRYLVRSVVRLPSGAMIEGHVSNEVEAMLKDDE